MKFIPYGKLKLNYLEYHQRLQPVLKRPQVRAYTMLVLSFFTMAFFGFFAIRPTLRTIAQLNREIADSRDLDGKLSKKISDLALIQADYELIRGALPVLDAALPHSAQFPSLVQALEDVSRATQASISALSFGSIILATPSARPATVGEPTDIAFKITFSGNYDQLMQTLRFLTNNKRILRFDGMTFATGEEQDRPATLTIAFQAKSFYY